MTSKIKKRKIYTLEEWEETGKRLYGVDKSHWKFKCIICKTVQSGKDFIDLGSSLEQSQKDTGYSYIGRVNGKGDTFFGTLGFDEKKGPKKKTVGYDWTLGGLFTMHNAAIIIEGQHNPIFEFADELKE